MGALALLSPRVWLELAIAAAVAGLIWWAYSWAYDRGADHVQRNWDAVELERSQQSAKIASDALATTKALQVSADKQLETKDAQIKAGNALAGVIASGLRDRPARLGDGSVPVNPSTGSSPGCTGASLFKQDAEFLVRESSRADKLRIDLQQCQAQYSAARSALVK